LSIKQLNSESYNKEAILIGILWNNPDFYGSYSEEVLNKKTMGNAIWAFFLGLGRYLYDKGISVFDDISVHSAVAELKLEDKFEKYGGYAVVEELMNETKEMSQNFEAYYDEVKKYALLREYYKLFGEKVLKVDGKYNYKEMTRNQISMYWNDKLSNIDIEHNDTSIVAYNLLADLDEFIERLDINPDIGMPFYRAKKFTEIMSGWALGTVYILSAFSGNGKSSFVVEKVVLSCILENEKLLIIANEMDIEQYKKLLIITAMGSYELYEKYKEHFEKPSFNRKNINKGNFTEEEKEKLKMAVKWLKEVSNGKDSLVKFVPLEDYTMDNVEKVVRKYARRGYKRIIVDTAKPSEKGKNDTRWEQFVEDFDRLYKLARKDGGGLNLAIFATVQSSDDFVGKYWLNERCLAESKKIKNVVDFVAHMRPVFPQEYSGGNKELKVINYIPRSEDLFNQDEVEEIDGQSDYVKQIKKLEHGKVYYLMFVSKNRRGQSNLTGLNVLVFQVDFNNNRWIEVGWATNVIRDM
jgi:replicative DNA helicase